MATPTPAAKHPTPSQTVATPRSVPSPALHRSQPVAQLARTPQSNGIKGGTPMVPSLSQASAGSIGVKFEGVSPANFGAASIGSVGSTTGLLNFASPNAMAAIEGMVMGNPGMGMSVLGQGKRDEDQERRRKVQGILGKLVGKDKSSRSTGMGRISDEGVRRVGRWAGFDVHIETKYQSKDHEGHRPIAIAGRNAVLIDLSFANNKADKVEVTFTSEDDEVLALQQGAAEVLKRDLTPAAVLNTSLDRFASNLEALARLDKLSSPTVNCVEAVAGIFSSLKRLYDYEIKETDGETESSAKRVMREKSGRPGMQIHGRVGPSLDYWSEKRAPTTSSRVKSSRANNQEEVGDEIYSIEITVEANTNDPIPPIRISKDWIGKDIVKAADATEDAQDATPLYTGLDWREPPQLPPVPKDVENITDDFAAPSTDNLPNVRFVARLHPPVVMPYTVATQVLQITGLPSNPPVSSSSYESLLLGLPTPPTSPALAIDRKIFLPRPDVEQDITQHLSLYVPKPEIACVLSSIPFSHPMHLVLALPLLRQWARLGHVLRTTFAGHVPTPIPASVNEGGSRKRIALDALLDPTASQAERRVDISLSTGGGGRDPALTLFAPWDAKGALCIRVAADGKMGVTSGGEEDAVLARGLEVDDLGVWAEWARERLAKGQTKEDVGMEDAQPE